MNVNTVCRANSYDQQYRPTNKPVRRRQCTHSPSCTYAKKMGKYSNIFQFLPGGPPGHFNPLKLNPSKNSQKIRIYFGAKMFINP